MDNIDTSRLKRNPAAFNGVFKIIGDVTITKKPIRIMFPERYINRGLGIMGIPAKILFIYAILDDDDNYALILAPIMGDVTPYNITTASVDDVDYKIMHFRENDVVISSNTMIRSDDFIYELFDEFYVKGNIPWYMEYDDTSNFLLETGKYANSDIGKNPLTAEILASIIARDPKDKRIFFRQSENTKDKPVYVGLSNIYYSLGTTAAKLVGGYFSYNLATSITDKETETSAVSDILRK